MSYALPPPPRPLILGVLVNRSRVGQVHLVAKNGTVLCPCHLHPEQVMLVEDVEISPQLVEHLCGGSLRKYQEISNG